MATVLTNLGEFFIVDKMDGTLSSTIKPQYLGVGTGAGTAAKTSTTVFGSIAAARATCTLSQPSADVFRAVGTYTATAALGITNAGLFSGSTDPGDDLIILGDFASVTLANGDAIQVTFNCEIT